MVKEKKAEMSFLEHLEVLRWHLLRSLVAILFLAILAFIFKRVIFDVIIIAPKTPEFPTNRLLCMLGQEVNIPRLCINSRPFNLQTVKMAEQFSMHIIVSLIAGFIVSFPYIFYEFWKFIKPAMYEKEKKTASGAVFYTSLLFMLGVAFGYYLIAPLSVHFLGNYRVSEEVISNPTLRSYVQTISSVVLASGIVFELPVLSYFLTKIGLITPEFLKKYRRHSLVLILALSALITPPDIFSQVMVSLPLIILYEVGIGISRRIIKDRNKKEAAEAA
jgi:sec-independent protein translocase protein TatC